MANVCFVGLEPHTAAQLHRALDQQAHKVEVLPADTTAEKLRNADVVFAAGDNHGYRKLLAEVRTRAPRQPFIVVTRLPDTRKWIDALEGGATDYCAEPLEPHQIYWLLDAALGRKKAKAAA